MNFSEESKGYSREQVQKVLAKLPPLANEVERLQNEIANLKAKADAAESRLVEAQAPAEVAVAVPEMPAMASSEFDETLRKTLVTAQANAQTTVRVAQEEAERLRTEAEFQSNAILADARDQASEIEREAEAKHEEMKAETESERARLLKEASDDVKKRLSSIEEELVEAHDSERSKLLEQISELQETHKLLQGDVSRFEEHLTSRREEVRVALADITAVLDDPEKLRVEEPIEPAEVSVIDTDGFEPIAVEVDSVSDLETEALVAEKAVASDKEESLDMDEFESLTIVDEELDVEEVFLDEVDDGEATGVVEAVETDDDNGNGDIPPPPPPVGDAYTEELRRAVDEESDDDTITSFFSEESVADEGKRGGIFGRRGK